MLAKVVMGSYYFQTEQDSRDNMVLRRFWHSKKTSVIRGTWIPVYKNGTVFLRYKFLLRVKITYKDKLKVGIRLLRGKGYCCINTWTKMHKF